MSQDVDFSQKQVANIHGPQTLRGTKSHKSNAKTQNRKEKIQAGFSGYP